MRKIEREMLEAIRTGQDWHKDNTSVIDEGNGGGRVFLHGHLIATFADCGGQVFPDLDTLREWPTATTKSRLRALGVDLHQDKGVLFIDADVVAHI